MLNSLYENIVAWLFLACLAVGCLVAIALCPLWMPVLMFVGKPEEKEQF